MGTKREEMDNPSSCLNKAADDEPIFVLRAQDLTAPSVVRMWAMMQVARHGQSPMPHELYAKIDAAYDTAAWMEEWAADHGGKLPD